MKVNFKKTELLDLGLPYSALEDTILDQTRWSTIHQIIFKKDEIYYRTTYSAGSTEQQYEEPWEYEELVRCEEVHKVSKVVEVWEAI